MQDGAIKIEVIDFEGRADREAKEKWALDFFKQDLLAKWFEPSLDLGQLKGAAQPEGLDAVLDRLKKLQPGGSAETKPTTTTPPATATPAPTATAAPAPTATAAPAPTARWGWLRRVVPRAG